MCAVRVYPGFVHSLGSPLHFSVPKGHSMATATVIKALVADVPVYNAGISPFQSGNYIRTTAPAASTLYGVNRQANNLPNAYAGFRQSVSGNRAFELPAGSAPITTVSTATQLRVVGILSGVVKARAAGNAVAPASSFIIAAGGGTAVANATLSIKGTTAANLLVGATSMSIASSGADVTTILVGDRITVAGDPTTYYATATSTAMNGTTEVLVPITPPLQVAKVAAQVVTITAATGKTAIFADTPAVGQEVEVWINAATDIVTVQVLAASREYQILAYDAMIATAALDLAPLAKA